ncbi:MAG: hypothetical protein ACE5KH_00300 [Candidatus Geothermarchaeales archaeon]
MVDLNPIDIVLASSHDILGIVMIIYIAVILRQFSGLPRLEKPWWAMVGALVIFLVGSVVNTIRAISAPFQVDPSELRLLYPFITLAVEIFDTLFIAALAISIYFFKKAWEEPR